MDDLVTLASSFGPKETLERLETEVRGRGMTVFALVDHAAGAAEVGMPLRPTVVVLFGNARAGTPLMQKDQRVGLDLPLRALVWEDAERKTWVTFEDPARIAARHGLGDVGPATSKMSAAIHATAKAATEA